MRKKYLWLATAACMAMVMAGCGNTPIKAPADNQTGTQGGTNPGAKPGEESKDDEEKEEEKLLKLSQASGFYDSAFNLEITCDVSGAKIYYTEDGTIPTAESKEYTSAIHIADKSKTGNVLSAIKGANPSGDYIPKDLVTKCTTIRAVAIGEDGEVIESTNGSYFVGIDRDKEYEKLPIISMYTDQANLFDYEKGIYVKGKTYDDWLAEDPNNKHAEGWQSKGNYSNKGREWEREALIEYIPAEGKSYSHNVGIRIMGAASRSANQKSFRLISREEYGKKNIKYGLIPDNMRSDGTGVVEKYRSFILRNGGNDNEFAKVRDPYLQGIVSNRSFDTMQSTPCYLFIDGEFWGMYTLAEDYSDHYIQNNYGIDDNEVIIIKRGDIEEGEEEDRQLYVDMYEFIKKNDMSDEANYKKACELLDIQSFIEYMAFELYIDNQDSIFEGNNWSMWRARTVDPSIPAADGKWRMLAFDSEYSTDIYGEGTKYTTNTVRNKATGDPSSDEGHRKPADLLKSLLKNEEFKGLFINTLCDMRNIDFEGEHAQEKLDEIIKLYKTGAIKTYNRFGPEWASWNYEEHFKQRTGGLATYMRGRYKSFIVLIKNAYGLENAGFLQLAEYDTSKVTITVNYTKLEANSLSGQYFKEYPVKLKAEALDGCKVKGFKVDGKLIEKSEIEVTVSDNTSIEVVVE